MYRLRFVPVRQVYQLHSEKGGAFEGGLKAIWRKAIELGIEKDEFEIALQEMTKLGHTVAEFGIYGRFIFTKIR